MSISTRGLQRAALAALASCAAMAALVVAPDARAGILPPVLVAPPPQDVALTGPDLVATATGATTVRIRNVGQRSAGAFSVKVTPGYIGECNVAVPGATPYVPGLRVGQTTDITVSQSSFDRTVTVDYLNNVVEANEGNNTMALRGTPVVC